MTSPRRRRIGIVSSLNHPVRTITIKRMRKNAGIVALLIFWICAGWSAGAATAQAQVLSDIERSRYNVASYYKYAEPGDVTIIADVWGTVRNPGVYEVLDGTTLSTLLSLAGGPQAQPRSERQDRTIQVRLYRAEGGGHRLVFDDEMENEIFASEENPVVRTGDVVTVDTVVRQRFTWREVFPIIAAVASVALAIERVVN